jgi:hypothetical protein
VQRVGVGGEPFGQRPRGRGRRHGLGRAGARCEPGQAECRDAGDDLAARDQVGNGLIPYPCSDAPQTLTQSSAVSVSMRCSPMTIRLHGNSAP